MALAMGVSAAQAGDFGVGINLGAAPVIEGDGSPTNFIIGAKFQWQTPSIVRLEAALDFGLRDKGASTINAMANAHFMIPVANQFYLYPLVGLGYGNVDWEYGKSYSKFAFNVGIGAEYEIVSNFGVNFEFKYQYMKDYNRLPILVGATYKF